MANGDLYEAAEQARRLSEAFLNRSRDQMQATFAEQRALAVGIPAGAVAGAAAGGGGGGTSMLAGTPAGRLLDTINQLIRTGAGVVGGAVGGPVVGAAGGLGAIAQGIGGGAAFLTSNAPFGPAGIGGGAIMGAQRNMSLTQTLYTAYGEYLNVFGLNRYAGQRLDMTQRQASEMAREELAYKMYGGGLKGVQAAWSLASFGLSNFMLRREGLEIDAFRREDFNRSLQANLRFTTRETLARAGLQQYASAFATGITRGGADVLGTELRRQLGQIQAETGASAEQVIALQARGMGTMGSVGLNQLLRRGAGAFAAGVQEQTRAVREIQQTLNLSEEEAQQFFAAMGHMHGAATRIAGLARNAQRAAGQMGMDVRDVFGIITSFENTGRQLMIGQTRTGTAGLRMAQRLRGWQMTGLMSQEEAMMYGGRTYEEGLQIMTQRMFEMGMGQFEQGRLGGLELMMRYRPQQFTRFMGGGMGFLQAAGVIGGAVMRDPLMQLRQRYDPVSRVMAGEEGLRMQYQRVLAMKQDRMFIFGGREEELLREFETATGMAPMEARKWFAMFERESRAIQRQVQDIDTKPENRKLHEQNIMQLHQRLRSEGLIGMAIQATGLSELEAVGEIYRRNLVDGKFDATKSTISMVKTAFVARERAASERGFEAYRGAGGSRIREAIRVARQGVARVGGDVDEGPASGGASSSPSKYLETGVTTTHLLAGAELIGQAAGEQLTPAEFAKRMFGRVSFITRSARAVGGESGEVVASVSGIDPKTGQITVHVGSITKQMTLEEMINSGWVYGELAKEVIGGFRKNIGGLDEERIRNLFMERAGNIDKGWSRLQGERFRQKLAGISGYLFGPGAEKLSWSQLAERFRGLTPTDQRVEALRARSPGIAQLLGELRSNPVEGLRRFLGEEDFSKAIEEVTGLTAKDIQTRIGTKTGLESFFNKDMINALIGHVMSKQDFEDLPVGSDATSAMFVQYGEDQINSLADAIGKAVAKYAGKK